MDRSLIARASLCAALLALGCSSGARSGGSAETTTETTAEPDAPSGVSRPLSLASRYSCAARDGRVQCWGLHPRAGDEPSIATYPELEGSVEIAAGDGMLCGRRADGTVRCNRRRFFRGGDGDGVEIAPVHGIDDAISVVAADAHACALHADGNVSCWGQNAAGQLGDPELGARGAPVRVEVSEVSALAAAGERTCAIADGSIVCWGRRLDAREIDPPTAFDAEGTFTAVALGARHMCALDASGAVRCWGDETFGALDAPDGRFDALISAGYAACAHGDDGWSCWGPRYVPTEAAVDAMRGAAAVALGPEHGCVMSDDEAVSCWGQNGRGQALGSLTHVRPPSQVVGLDDAVDVETHSGGRCALRENGRVVCWGRLDAEPWEDADGEDEEEEEEDPREAIRRSAVPVEREGIEGAVELAMGSDHGCVRTESGSLSCWGSNEHGQLGIPGVTIAREATAVPGVEGVEAVCAAGAYTCVITSEHAVRCVGAAGEGDHRTDQWIDVPNTRGAQQLACGDRLGCALLEGGDVVCWGDDLSRDTRMLPGRRAVEVRSRPPTARRFARGATALWVGDDHACVRTAEHPTLACFGYGDTGELGVEQCGGSTERCVLSRELVPFPEASAEDAVFLAHGTCLRRGEGPVRCWGGRDAHYDGFSLEPATLARTEGAVGLTTGCARFEDGTVRCWGGNRAGEVGDGTMGSLDAPREVPLEAG